ncbi:glycosyltransferase family 4 protein [Patescibacteria group bacterium]|nr:glycosyltransferase family 4 protein [Patescibacteria group bacterium]MDE1946807.1 glycosyltransferase family 4 protein [Patescibacteria group bacterium]MDE2011145.1 glycosyltransferase family 4 protein [Patescibacteria group bacterium]MDE2233054.1 glycosyltransferase family 4 protein [Patescibacteria group bacterium]
MKILVLSDDFPPHSFGGAGMVAFNLSKEMQRRGHQVRVVTTVRTDSDAGRFEYEGLAIDRIASDYDLKWQSFRCLKNQLTVDKVAAIIAEYKPDVVHAHNIHAHLSYHSLSLAKQSGAKVILTCHDIMTFHFGKFTEYIDPHFLDMPQSFDYHISPFRQLRAYRLRYNPWRNMVIRRVLRQSVDNVVAVSDSLKQAMEQNGITNVERIYNGIGVNEWQVPMLTVQAFKAKHGLAGKRVAMFSGRLEGAKGAWELFKSFEKIAAEMPEARLLVVAKRDRSAESKLAYAAEKGFADKVVFTGWLSGSDLHAAYAAADVIVNPSVCLDTFGLVNIEAMALRKPVVATCFGGSPEIVVDGQTGYIVNPLDLDLMAQKVKSLLTDHAKAVRFGEAGYARVKNDFSLVKQADEYEKVYRG